ncbi:AbrB/MazE/SpoVT family DNA-binding domain-containing protein [Candidatus Bathyarchaeota archaeon]|nr:AbrB/MazE/SpoVT family DNA-binding domain-containing protein [Candidatus Bathyarchaeota archaeon]
MSEMLVDSKGRITLPKEVRDLLEVGSGDKLKVTVVGDKAILERVENPFEVLENLLKDIKFDLNMRAEAEKMAVEEAEKRVR